MELPAIVVPGSSHRPTRVRLVQEAERVTRRLGAQLVVLTGRNEAAHMRSLWRGPDVELVVEETATSTVENAVRTLPLLVDRGAREAVVVVAPAHLPRAGWIFRRVYGAREVRVRLHAARVLPTPGAVLYELAAACIARRQVAQNR